MRWSIVALLALLPGPAVAQGQGERLGHAPLDGFVSGYRAAAPGAAIEEFVPEGETVERWTRMVTVQRFEEVPQGVDPLAFARHIADDLHPASCAGSASNTVSATQVSGRAAARLRSDCSLVATTGQPETFFMIAVAGEPGLHVLQAAVRRQPTADDEAWASALIGGVVLCEAGSDSRSCR